ncbi:GNAT family N-acetyltransferase [Agrilactobacillus composti]|nr:GNAT family N-acetyltransferase [Agrilactobacillus composti]
MKIHYRPAEMQDLATIMTIEHSGFTDDEAATINSMHDRIERISDTFLEAVDEQGAILGYIVGPSFNQRYLTDALFDKTVPNKLSDQYQTVLSLVVQPQFRRFGVASGLLAQLAKVAQQQGRQAITLTCLKALVPFYERNGYQNEGVSSSEHAGEVWYNMVLTL